MSDWKAEGGFDLNNFIQRTSGGSKQNVPRSYGNIMPRPQQKIVSTPPPPPVFQVPSDLPPQSSSPSPEATIFPFIEGSVFLLWKDHSQNAEQLSKEANVFPIKGSTYMVDHRDFKTEGEKVKAVQDFMQIIQRYQDTVNRTGQYIVIVGSVVQGIETRDIVVY